jgi:hypothetical protein
VVTISTADNEPPGWPLPAWLIMVTIFRRKRLAIAWSSGIDKGLQSEKLAPAAFSAEACWFRSDSVILAFLLYYRELD